jgi:hypothetical protein
MIKKSYFLMNNIILSKIRLSMFFGITINLSFIFFYKSNKILSINFLYVIFYVFIASLIGTIIYDPFDLIIIRKNNNDSNAIYYLFAYYSDLQNRIKFQQALNFHRKQCNICDMCIKLQGNKSITEEENDREHNNDFFNKIYSGHNRYLHLLKFIMENYIEQKFKYISCSPQVFMNILVNAAHAIKAGGKIGGKIIIGTKYSKNNLIVKIKDNGCGIKEPQKIFDAGYTTKGVGVGTGLGLAISQKIIEKHHGKINFKTEIDKGSEFIITIPSK